MVYNKSLRSSHDYLPIWIKFVLRIVHIMIFSDYESYENRRREVSTIVVGVSKIMFNCLTRKCMTQEK